MTTPIPAAVARPGWRGTDPDGGTWVLGRVSHSHPWQQFDSEGHGSYRTQEEAEAADLVLLVTRTKVDEVRARLTDMVDEACRSRDQARRERDDAFESGRTEGYRCGWSDAAAPDATIRDAAVSLSYWLAEQLGEHVDDAYDRGETVADTVKRLVAKVSAPAPLHPRQVATAEELDALPDSAVVVDADGGSWQRNGHINCVPMWDRSGESERWTSGEISLPAVVVWIPGAAAPAPLDPGNPEHLRPALGVVEAFMSRYTDWDLKYDNPHWREVFAKASNHAHDRERERPEAESRVGLHSKYRVERVDGKPQGPCFVLSYSDRHSIPAMHAYADSCEAERPVLAADLRKDADRLDRERAEAKQDAAEEAFVQGIYERWCASDGTDHDLIREAIRAERARQEAGQ